MTSMLFGSSLVAFVSFVLLLLVLVPKRALCWDITFGSTFGAVWWFRAIFLEVFWLFASETPCLLLSCFLIPCHLLTLGL